jgi:hypothetical protein
METLKSVDRTLARRRAAPLIMGLAGCAAVAAFLFWPTAAPRKSGAEVINQPSRGEIVQIENCQKCHEEQAAQFRDTGHFHALHPAGSAQDIARFAGQSFTDGTFPPQKFEARGDKLYVVSDVQPAGLLIDWMLGSGTHGQTPISVRTASDGTTQGMEYHASWYPEHGLNMTMGHAGSTDMSGIEALGMKQSTAQLVRCFGCHTTDLPVKDSEIDFAHIVPGVQCQRCHEDAARHAREAENAAVSRKPAKTPLEAVDQCAQCHRAPFDVKPETITPDNTRLTRFAPIGLTKSRCFTEQAQHRLDCATCHDVHRPMASHETYLQVCQKCHEGRKATDCVAAPATEDCLKCHLAKVQVEPTVEFTDHWIRVREPEAMK